MATDVIMPALGVAQEKGTLLNWHKAKGQSVTKGEPLMEIETDKATVEIEAPASGILTNVTASPGDEIPVGNKIAVILAPGETVDAATQAPAKSPEVVAQKPAPAKTKPTTETKAPRTEVTRRRSALKEKGEELVPSINDFILSASARALKDFPSLNASVTDHGVEIYSDINIGVAVALEEGLVVPVIRNGDRLSLQELAKESRELAEKAQTKKLFPLDYEGGTFTVSNLGMFGVDNFVAIINPPQCAILAVGQVAPRVVPYGEGIAVRPMMTMSLSADHRVVD